MDDSDKQKLIEQFRQLLDDPDIEIDANLSLNESNGDVDLFRLFSELVAIKNEVRLQGRHFKSALDLVGDDHSFLKQQFVSVQSQASEISLFKQLDFLNQLLLLRDRIVDGIDSSDQYRTTRFSLIPRTRENRIIKAMLEGQQLSLKRLDQILNQIEVLPINTLGRKFDENTMNAVAMSHSHEYDDGVVSKEFRSGYCCKDRVIRLADVRVNRIIRDD